MGCNCKNFTDEIAFGKSVISELRYLFIRRMTEDSHHNDKRRKDYNKAIFHYESKEDVDAWNETYEKLGLPKKGYGASYQCFSNMDVDMVLKCFDDATKDWRKSWCDTENCNRK